MIFRLKCSDLTVHLNFSTVYPLKKGTATHADALGCQPLSTKTECKLNWLDSTPI